MATTLTTRWRRARISLLVSMVLLPLTPVLACLVFTALIAAHDGATWWVAITVVVTTATAGSLMVWLRRHGMADPHSWLPATALMTGAEVVFGVVPGFGVTVGSVSGPARLFAGGVLAFGLTGPALACRLAHHAHSVLLRPLTPELGSTRFPLVLDDVHIDDTGVEWTDRGVAFAHLHDVVPRNRSVVLHTPTGCWDVPTAEPELLAAVLARRKALWDSRLGPRCRECSPELMTLETVPAGFD